MMSYQHLWTVFRPGCTIYAPVFGQPRAFTLGSYEYHCGDNPGLYLNLNFVDFDGEKFGTRSTGRLVAAFSGAERINGLSAFDMIWHDDPDSIKAQLIQRGRKFEKYAGMHFGLYKGVALEYTSCGINRYNTDGRVVIDTKTSHRLNADYAFSVTPNKSGEYNVVRMWSLHC